MEKVNEILCKQNWERTLIFNSWCGHIFFHVNGSFNSDFKILELVTKKLNLII